MTGEKEAVEVLGRLMELVKSDPQLHEAILNLINAITDLEKAKAEYQRSRIHDRKE